MAVRDEFLVLGGINQDNAYSRPGEGDNAPHERAGAAFLTGIHPTRGGQLQISVDQIAAKELGKDTQLSSLELGLHDPEVAPRAGSSPRPRPSSRARPPGTPPRRSRAPAFR